MKISPNAPCPCHSGKKYKQCCQPYHKGILPSTAEKLMRSRYSAFALGLAEYIMATTHSNNSDYTEEKENWKKSILNFSQTTHFLGLKISEFMDGDSLCEKSRFLNVEGKWLYESGTFTSTDHR